MGMTRGNSRAAANMLAERVRIRRGRRTRQPTIVFDVERRCALITARPDPTLAELQQALPTRAALPAVFDGPIDNPTVLAYVEQVLAPALEPGDVVPLDNLAPTS